jgi:hypothetical protein
MARISNYSTRHGEVAEWLKATVLKIVTPCKRRRGFKSYPLRQNCRQSQPAAPVKSPEHHWRSYGTDPLPTAQETATAADAGVPALVLADHPPPLGGHQNRKATPTLIPWA